MTVSRDEVHAELTALFAEGGALFRPPSELGVYFDELTIVRIAKKYMARSADVVTGGRAIVVSAGPPGAGKSAVLKSLSLDGYRNIDPDEVKDMILDEAERHGLLGYRHDIVLSDQRPVGLRELASHVHGFSTRVADIARALSLAAGENVIIDGTLSWAPLTGIFINEFYRAGYEALEVVDVEIPLELALERGKERWWRGRESDVRYGGRFVPDVAIQRCYEFGRPDSSVCAVNALDLAERAADELGAGSLRRFDVDTQSGRPYQVSFTAFN